MNNDESAGYGDSMGEPPKSLCDECGQKYDPRTKCKHEDRVAVAIAKLPKVFKLRGFPGEYFRASYRASYINDNDGVTIYLQKFFSEKDWRDHSKGTLREILRELVEYSGDKKFGSDAQVDAYLRNLGGEQPDQHLLDKLEEP